MDRRRRRQNVSHRARRPLENGYCESLNSKLLNGEIFYSLKDAKVVI